ncbi:cytochrome c [Histidinibacterium aquaticum]|uniref:Cytochrome c n=2 Tax=Histidinibacterium aquaticum TaxID=2613962 RepID=A0A5J5GMW9_9RHOB|nr:cytochrome c [Histidinibacterium aquaticum]KAA9009490.1 cytochrome c [Histidinibacterium aquaticum]
MTLTAALFLLPAAASAEHLLGGRDIDAGAALYAEHCASCHGAELEGQPDWQSPGPDGVLPAPPHDVTGHTWHHDSQLLLDYVRLGGAAALEARGVSGFESGMPGLGDQLSESDILDILGFIRSTWPEHAKRVQQERTHGASD